MSRLTRHTADLDLALAGALDDLGLDQQQQQQHGQAAGSSGGGAPGVTSAGGMAPAWQQQLMAMMQAQAQAQAQSRGAPLGMVWSGDAAARLALDPEAVARLLPLLPPELRNTEQLRRALSSPQAAQAASNLGRALDGPGAASLFAAAGLSPADGADAMAAGDSTGAFLDAMQAREGRRRPEGASQGGAGGQAPMEGDGAGGDGDGSGAGDGGSGGDGGEGGDDGSKGGS